MARRVRFRVVGALVDEIVVGDAPEAWAALGFAVDGEAVALGDVRVRAAGPEVGRGLVEWSLRGIESAELDGLPTRIAPGGDFGAAQSPTPANAPADSEAAQGLTAANAHADSEAAQGPPAANAPADSEGAQGPTAANAPAHPNGVTAIDHVVAITPRLERTVAALQAAGLDLRRIREEPTPAGAPRQAFFRLGPTILEVVQEPAEIAAENGPDRPAFFWGLALLAPDLDATVAALGPERVSEVRAAVQPGRRIASLRRAAGLSLPVALITPRPPR